MVCRYPEKMRHEVARFYRRLAGNPPETVSIRIHETGSIQNARISRAVEKRVVADGADPKIPSNAPWIRASASSNSRGGPRNETLALARHDPASPRRVRPGSPRKPRSSRPRPVKQEGHIALYGIRFEFDSDRLRPEPQAAISEIAQFLKSHPKVKLSSATRTTSEATAITSTFPAGVPRRWSERSFRTMGFDLRGSFLSGLVPLRRSPATPPKKGGPITGGSNWYGNKSNENGD